MTEFDISYEIETNLKPKLSNLNTAICFIIVWRGIDHGKSYAKSDFFADVLSYILNAGFPVAMIFLGLWGKANLVLLTN